MDGYLIKLQSKMGMLNQGIKIFVIVTVMFFTSCHDTPLDLSQNMLIEKAKHGLTEAEYFKIYKNINDTIEIWCLNRLGSVEGEAAWGYYIDSIICFNSEYNRLYTAILVPCKSKNSSQDEIKFLLGEKINSFWFFFRGASIAIPREVIKGHDIHKPFSYKQLHEIALKEVYGGLNSKGEINEEWFTNEFEGNGWGIYPETPADVAKLTRKDFEMRHLRKVRSNWAGRDTTQPVKQLPSKNTLP